MNPLKAEVFPTIIIIELTFPVLKHSDEKHGCRDFAWLYPYHKASLISIYGTLTYECILYMNLQEHILRNVSS